MERYLYCLYYWFSVGKATLPLHHLIFDFSPATPDKLRTVPPPSYKHTHLFIFVFPTRQKPYLRSLNRAAPSTGLDGIAPNLAGLDAAAAGCPSATPGLADAVQTTAPH
jgi:hypothetical protein